MSERRGEPAAGQFSYEGLQRLFHEKARLGLMTSLVAASEGLVFGELKRLCALSDGNLNRHLKVLEEAGYVARVKLGAGRGARTTVTATARGKRAFAEYLDELERVLAEASAACRAAGWHPTT
jgi:DNA-binding MarR family transcriptional regulator